MSRVRRKLRRDHQSAVLSPHLHFRGKWGMFQCRRDSKIVLDQAATPRMVWWLRQNDVRGVRMKWCSDSVAMFDVERTRRYTIDVDKPLSEDTTYAVEKWFACFRETKDTTAVEVHSVKDTIFDVTSSADFPSAISHPFILLLPLMLERSNAIGGFPRFSEAPTNSWNYLRSNTHCIPFWRRKLIRFPFAVPMYCFATWSQSHFKLQFAFILGLVSFLSACLIANHRANESTKSLLQRQSDTSGLASYLHSRLLFSSTAVQAIFSILGLQDESGMFGLEGAPRSNTRVVDHVLIHLQTWIVGELRGVFQVLVLSCLA